MKTKSFVLISLFVVLSVCNYNCNDNPVSYNSNQTGFSGQVNAINTGGPTIDGGIEYKGVCKIALLGLSMQTLSEFDSDSLGKFKRIIAPGHYYLRVLSPKLSDDVEAFIVNKNNFTHVIAVYDMKLK